MRDPKTTLIISHEALTADASNTACPVTEQTLRELASLAFEKEGIPHPCYAALTLVDNEQIRQINRDTRRIDRATDVLSFPAIAYSDTATAGQSPNALMAAWDIDMGACFIGDIFISLPRAATQAEQYGHSLAREICYLLVHGLCHLMGYDHMNEEDQSKMRAMEEQILSAANQSRHTKEDLLRFAKEAMKNAYAPYSGYRVGACVLTKSGEVFTGCNVENAAYGLTNCGERTAIFKAVSEGHTDLCAVAIAAENMPPWPCGACRQVLSEFAADMPVYITWDGHTDESTLKALLPHSFSPANGVQEHLGGQDHA